MVRVKRALAALLSVVVTLSVASGTSVAMAAVSAPKTSGLMSGEWQGYYYDLYTTPVQCQWRWNAEGALGDRPARGSVSYKVTYRDPAGVVQVLESRSWPVVEVRRVSPGVVDVYTDGGHGPTPGWGEPPFRVVDGGRVGDQLLIFCYVHQDFHVIAASGQARVR